MVLGATYGKLLDIEKFSVYLTYSYEVFPVYPINIARFLGLTVPWLELLIGLGLVFGVLTRLSAIGWEVLSITYFLVLLHVIFIQERVIPCGCFPGLFPEMRVTHAIWIHVFMMPASLQLILTKGGNFLNGRGLLPERWQKRMRFIW
jgi:uncharacterized membrane protein YphA (DoxX/SURF4 family)